MIVPNAGDGSGTKASSRIHAGAGEFDGTQVANSHGKSNCQWCNVFLICKYNIWENFLNNWSHARWMMMNQMNRTWFIGITNTANGEDKNESKEEFNAQSLQWLQFSGQCGMSQCALVRLWQQGFQWRRSSCSSSALGNNVEQSAYNTHFTGDEHRYGDGWVNMSTRHMANRLLKSKTTINNITIDIIQSHRHCHSINIIASYISYTIQSINKQSNALEIEQTGFHSNHNLFFLVIDA